MRRATAAVLVLAAVLLAPARGGAFVERFWRWADPEAEMFVGALPSQFEDAFESAADDWRTRAGFEFDVRGSSRDPCDLDGGVDFTETVCGDDWPEDVLALAVTGGDECLIAQGNNCLRGLTGAWAIVFNDDEPWGVYDGPLRSSPLDFRRVALHELGHIISLGHEDGLIVDGRRPIMASFVTDTDRLENDDIQGVCNIYEDVDCPPAFGALQLLSAVVRGTPGEIPGAPADADVGDAVATLAIEAEGFFN